MKNSVTCGGNAVFFLSRMKNFIYLHRVKIKLTDMATITIEYDARNIGMRKLIDALLSLGAKRKGTELEKSHESALKSLKEIREGKGIRCKDMKEYKKSLEDI